MARAPSKDSRQTRTDETDARAAAPGGRKPTPVQRAWLIRGLDQPGGKLPLFDADGREVSERTVRACIAAGWAEPWFSNPIKPDWLVCRLTERGVRVLRGAPGDSD